jgi:hypothetical protein
LKYRKYHICQEIPHALRDSFFEHKHIKPDVYLLNYYVSVHHLKAVKIILCGEKANLFVRANQSEFRKNIIKFTKYDVSKIAFSWQHR